MVMSMAKNYDLSQLNVCDTFCKTMVFYFWFYFYRYSTTTRYITLHVSNLNFMVYSTLQERPLSAKLLMIRWKATSQY